MRSDQLTNLMARGMIFDGFREALWPPPFLPTYKCKMRSSKTAQSNSLPRFKKKKNGMDTSLATTGTLQETVNYSAGSQSNSSNSSSPTSQSVDSSASSITTNKSSSTVIDKTTNNSATLSSKLLKKSTSSSRSVPLHLNSLSDDEEEDDEDVISSSFNTSRVPSFTDRVLYQARLAVESSTSNGTGNGINLNNNGAIHCLSYNAIRSVDSSDHKPVRALFEVALDSGGPRVPFRLKKQHLSLIHQNTNNIFSGDEPKLNMAQRTSDSSNVISSSSSEQMLPSLVPSNDQTNVKAGNEHHLKNAVTTANISSFFGRRLGKKGRQKRKEFKLQQQQERLLHGSVSMSSLPTAVAALNASLDSKLTRLNAGAFERQVFIDGLRLRNSLASSNNQNKEPDQRPKQPKYSNGQSTGDNNSHNHKRSLFKSKSFDSNIDGPNPVNVSTSVVITPPVQQISSSLQKRPQSEKPVTTSINSTQNTGNTKTGSANGTAISTSIGNSNPGSTSQDNLSKSSSICSIA